MTFSLDLRKLPMFSAPTPPVPPPVRTVRNGVTIDPPMVPVSEPSRRWCFFGVHKYEISNTTTWSKANEYGTVYAKGPMYILRCTVCGKVKAQCM